MKQLQKRKIKRKIWITLLVVCFVVFVFSGWQLVRIFQDYREGDKVYENLELVGRETVALDEDETPKETEKENEDPEEQTGEENEGDETKETEEADPEDPYGGMSLAEYHKQYHVKQELDINGFTVRQLLAEQYAYDFDALKAINPDVVGWIMIEGTNIDYPIVHSKDNDEYLNMTLSGEYNKAGSIFLDNRCEELFGYNTIIYGHNMRNTAMFHDVENYRDPAYLKAHPLIHIITPTETRTYQIYSCYETPGVSKTFAQITSTGLYQQYIDYSLASSEYDTGVSISYTDNIITLSTCTNTWNNHRYIVHAKQIY